MIRALTEKYNFMITNIIIFERIVPSIVAYYQV